MPAEDSSLTWFQRRQTQQLSSIRQSSFARRNALMELILTGNVSLEFSGRLHTVSNSRRPGSLCGDRDGRAEYFENFYLLEGTGVCR